MEAEQKKLLKSQLEIEFELTEEEFKHFIERALEHFKKHIKVDGFRPGRASNKLVEDKIKTESLLMEAGDIAVRETYSKYILENKLEPIGQPEVTILKIAKGNPFIFKAKITVLPDVELPDYKKIASKIKSKEISVTEEEVLDSINYLQKTRAKFTLKNEPAEKKDFVEIIYQNKDIENNKEIKDRFILGEGGFMQGFEDNLIGMKAGEEKEFSVKFSENSLRKDLAGKEGVFKVKMISVQKMELPKINDEFARSLGSSRSPMGAEMAAPRSETKKEGESFAIEPQATFNTLDALKQSLKEGITIEKQEEEKQRKRGEILEKIAEKAKFEMPETMVEYEKQILLEDLKNKITQNIKISFEEYLASIKKTEAGMKETYRKEAEKRLRGFLILREIGKKENIEVLDNEVEEEVSRTIKNYSKENLAKVDIEQLKEYTKGVIHDEKIFQLLESFSE